jgi:ABC-type uncharacterized transport system auxiliary subunit
LSTRRRTSFALAAALALALAGCSEEQSKEIGRIPKKTMDKAADDVQKAMRQGSERLKEDDR